MSYIFKIGFILYVVSFAIEAAVDIPFAGNKIMLPECIFLAWALAGAACFLYRRADIVGWIKSGSAIEVAVLCYFGSVVCSYCSAGATKALGEVFGSGYFVALYFMLSFCCSGQIKEMQVLFLKTLVFSGLLAAVTGIFLYFYSLWTGHLTGVSLYVHYPLIGDTWRVNGFMRNAAFMADLLVGAFFAFYLLCNRVSIGIYTKTTVIFLLFTGLMLTKEKIGLLFLLGLLWLLPHFLPILINRWKRSGRWLLSRPFRMGMQGIALFGVLYILFTVHFLVYQNLSDHPFKQFEIIFPVHWGHTTWYVASTPYVDLKKAALLAFAEHPIFGVGGNCLIQHTETLIARGDIIQPLCCAPHSTFFGVFGELGILGFGALVFLLITVFNKIQVVFEGREMQVAMVFFAYFCIAGANMDMMNIRQYWIWLVFLALAPRR